MLRAGVVDDELTRELGFISTRRGRKLRDGMDARGRWAARGCDIGTSRSS
jgi:hypothetical protein